VLPAERDVVAERVAPQQLLDPAAEQGGGLQPLLGLVLAAYQPRQIGQRLVLENHEALVSGPSMVRSGKPAERTSVSKPVCSELQERGRP
jgi:hypothetical protein